MCFLIRCTTNSDATWINVSDFVNVISYLLENHYTIQGIQQTLLSKATYIIINYICQKKEKQQYTAVGTVLMFIETSTKHLQSLG